MTFCFRVEFPYLSDEMVTNVSNGYDPMQISKAGSFQMIPCTGLHLQFQSVSENLGSSAAYSIQLTKIEIVDIHFPLLFSIH